jgi:drug/metabolite transporter (DMT)-like permease
VLGVLAASTGSIFVRQADAPALLVSFWRCAFATLILGLLRPQACRLEWSRLARGDVLCLMGAGLALALHFWAWIASLGSTTVASSLVIVNTTPVWVGLATPFLTTDRISRAMALAIGVAVSGCIVIGAGDLELSREALFGDGLALLGAWAVAAYFLLGRRLARSLSLVPYVVACYGTAALVLLAILLVAGAHPFDAELRAFGWMFALALVPQVLGHTSYNYALRFFSASGTAVATLGEAICGSLLAWWILGEVPGGMTFGGGAVVFIGLLLAVRAERRTAQPN